MDNLCYSAGSGEWKNWIVAETKFNPEQLGKCEAIFCQGNGYLCVRNALEERYVFETRNMFVTGTFDRFDETEVTELPNLPDMTNLTLLVNGQRFSLEEGRLEEYSRSLNLKNGETVRCVVWTAPHGERISFRFRRFVSLKEEHLFAERVEIIPLTEDILLQAESAIDGRMTNTGTQHFREGAVRLYEQTDLEMISETVQSKIPVALHSAMRLSVDGKQIAADSLPVIERRYLSIRAKARVRVNESLAIEKVCTVHTGRDLAYQALSEPDVADRLHRDGLSMLQSAISKGYETLFRESADEWGQYWRRLDITVESANEFDQLALRFALYHLNIMVKRDDNRVGIGAKGMSGEGYKGHSFWDTEIFILPHFTLTDPKTARTLLEYRYKGLYGARRKAKEYGYEGAMYPWESAWIDDGEVTPLHGAADVVTGKPIPILTGMIEHHISADIAFAVWQYFTATGDEDFMERYGNEIILETARFWCSRVAFDEGRGKYVIDDVIGPDEYKEHVDNNAYTNYLAAYNLELAIRVMDLLKSGSGRGLAPDLDSLYRDCLRVRDRLYLPEPNDDGIVEQFEGYSQLRHIDLAKYKQASRVGTIYEEYNMEQINELQVSKQADLVMLLFLLDDLFSKEIKEKNYRFYETRTLHDSSLSKSTHSVLAQDLGDEDTAYALFEGACRVDLGQEMHSSDLGIHSAAMGGIWQCAVYGFGGVRIVGDELHIAPSLPRAWERLRFSVVWRGQTLSVAADHQSATVANRGDAPVSIRFYGDDVAVGPGKSVAAEQPKKRQ